MGTTYNIKIIGRFHGNEIIEIKKGIEKVLKDVNSSMSLFDKSSEISEFNRLKKNEDFKVTWSFLHVLKKGREIHTLTRGAWDASTGPLVRLWGFSNKKKTGRLPGDEAVLKGLKMVGYTSLEIDEENLLIKKSRDIYLDLGSIAKGYGVDSVSGFLKDSGVDNFMVEIGGEVYTAGKNIRNKKWRIGINRPDKSSGVSEIIEVISVSEKGVATSGTYRNFINIGGKEYSHIIDPRTGYPVESGIVSVSVVSKDCTTSDGLATGILVMGRKEGINLCNNLKNTECMIIERENGFKTYYSKGFKDLLP